MMKNYPVSERFLSFQGEGLHVGRKAYFIRLFGCNVKCPWCDTKYAWQGAPKAAESAESLARAAADAKPEFAVITGGEPCIHDLAPLVAEFKKLPMPLHLETSGTAQISDTIAEGFSWITLSPKLFNPPTEQNLRLADELKFVISDPSELPLYARFIAAAKNAKAAWLQPEFSRANDGRILRAITDFVLSNGGIFRAGVQLHKLYFIR